MTSLIAILGTLIGSAGTYLIQRSTVRQQSSLAQAETLRRNRLEAFAAYGGALHSYRKARMDRWHVLNGSRRADPEPSRDEVYALRTVVFDHRIRLRLLIPGDDLIEVGTQVIATIDAIDPDCSHEEYLAACEAS
ncbi:hypothetical protein J2S40_002463 [Nocardioides luteus]|nr:hypothetical protein [Nocardioides luteus]MDR7311405.1 hypothetical protein [Nocardioides luteus]